MSATPGLTRIGVVGAGGRMGRMLIEAALKDEQLTLGAAFDVAGSPAVGKNAGELVGLPSDVVISDDLAGGLAAIDFLIDFTRPEGTLHHLELCRKAGVGMVIGTTGFDEEGKAAIAAAATDVPVVGVAICSESVVPGCGTGASHEVDIALAVKFAVEVAKEFGRGSCAFYDAEEYARLLALYGSLSHLSSRN